MNQNNKDNAIQLSCLNSVIFIQRNNLITDYVNALNHCVLSIYFLHNIYCIILTSRII